MNIIEIKENEAISAKYSSRGMDYSIPKKVLIHINNYYTLGYNNHVGNCKVCTIESLQPCLENKYDKTIERLNELFKAVHKLCFFCTFNDTKCIKSFEKHFKKMYCVKVPIGYGGSYQYHCLFMTNGVYSSKDAYISRLEKEGTKLIS